MKFVNWASRPRIVVINRLLIALIASLFIFQLVRPLDVLQDWQIELAPAKEYKVIEGKRYAVYHPNETLIFTSSSNKVATADGVWTRNLVCQPTTELGEREILLDSSPTSRETGLAPERASSIVLPDVVQFNRLPRICKLVIDITYKNVALWRNHSEHAETEYFIVEELRITPQDAKQMIEELTKRIEELETLQNDTPLPVQPQNQQSNPQPSAPQSAPQSEGAPSNPSTPVISEGETPLIDTPPPPQPEPGLIRRLANPLLNLIGL